MTGTEFLVGRSSYFNVPIILDEATTTAVTVVSSPDSEINFSSTEAATTTSAELVANVWVDLSETTTDETVVVTRAGTTVATLIVKE